MISTLAVVSGLVVLVSSAAPTSAAGPCGSNPQLTDSLGTGFDIVRGESLAQPVLGLTYNLGGGFLHPYSRKVFCVPDQANVLTVPSLDTVATIYHSAQDVAREQARSWGVDVGVSVLGLSAEVSKANSFLSNGSAVYSRLQQDFKIYDVAINAPVEQLPLSEVFSQLLAKLPPKYDPDDYAQLVEAFGTHVVVRGEFGGQVVMRTAVAAEFVDQQASSSAALNAHIAYHLGKGSQTVDGTIFSRDGTSSQYQQLANDNYEVQYVGGDPEIGAAGNLTVWRQWMESVKTQPVRINQRLVNITAFVADPTIRANLETYIAAYLSTGAATGPVTPKPSTFPVGPCHCTGIGEGGSCPAGYYTVAMSTDKCENNPSASGMVCCDMCDTYAPDPSHGFPPAFGSVTSDPTSAATKQQVRAATPIATTGEFCPVPSEGAFPSDLCVPGTSWLGSGLSLLTGKPTNFPVVAPQFQMGQTWQDPFSNTTYAVADEVAVSSSSNQQAQLTSAVFGSQSQYAHAVAHHAGLDQDILFGNSGAFGSFDAHVQNSQQTFAGSRGLVAKGIGELSLYQVALPPPLLANTTAGFNAAVDALPSTYDQAAYFDFLQRYGTHVITSVTLGGRATVHSAVDQFYYSGNSASAIGANAVGTWDWFKLGVNYNGSASSSFRDFQSSSASYLEMAGGDFDSTTIAASMYDAWVASVQRAPVPVQMQSARITQFVADMSKAPLVDQAITALVTLYNQSLPAVPVQAPQWGAFHSTSIEHGQHCKDYAPSALVGFGGVCSPDKCYCNEESCRAPEWSAAQQPYAAPGQPVMARGALAVHTSFEEGSPVCPPGSYNIGWDDTYNGVFGWYDKLPITCAQYGYTVSVSAV